MKPSPLTPEEAVRLYGKPTKWQRLEEAERHFPTDYPRDPKPADKP